MVFKTSKKFLEPADTLRATGGVAPGVVVVVFDFEGCFKSLPFLGGEEGAEVGGVEVVVFVGADGLHCVSLDM